MTVIPVVRDPQRVPEALRAQLAPARIADLAGPSAALGAALGDATVVINTAHARHIPAILQATRAGTPVIGLGSTRKFTRWMDAHGQGVLAGEAALLRSGRQGMLLHPTMIYGAQGEDNVQRLAALLRRLPVVPLPGGGRALVQPVHQDDVTLSLLAALDRVLSGVDDGAKALVIAGPAAIPYRAFVQAVAQAANGKARPIMPLPAAVLMGVAPLAARLPGFPKVGVAEIRRLLEDKAFDVTPMRKILGVAPRPLQEGLAALFTG